MSLPGFAASGAPTDLPLSPDFEELLDLIKSSATGEIVRPSKARKMFASRACRKSVMFGKPLNSNQMTTVNFS